jgi:hypothetical protein
MKITITNEFKKPKATFNNYDFFINDAGGLRQIIPVVYGTYITVNPDDRFGKSTEHDECYTAQDAAERYVSSNGKIKKVEVKEIIVELTGEEL